EAFGGRVVRGQPVHGKTSQVHHDGGAPFTGLPDGFEATRYHSLIVEEGSLPPELEVAARTADGVVMALRHRDLPAFGGPFPPESVLTGEGKRLLANCLAGARREEVPA